jgi:hypothetical protein
MGSRCTCPSTKTPERSATLQGALHGGICHPPFPRVPADSRSAALSLPA